MRIAWSGCETHLIKDLEVEDIVAHPERFFGRDAKLFEERTRRGPFRFALIDEMLHPEIAHPPREGPRAPRRDHTDLDADMAEHLDAETILRVEALHRLFFKAI